MQSKPEVRVNADEPGLRGKDLTGRRHANFAVTTAKITRDDLIVLK